MASEVEMRAGNAAARLNELQDAEEFMSHGRNNGGGNDGYSPLDNLAEGSSRSRGPSSSVVRRCLSWTTAGVLGAWLLYVTYEYGVGRGVRTAAVGDGDGRSSDADGGASAGPWRVFPGDDDGGGDGGGGGEVATVAAAPEHNDDREQDAHDAPNHEEEDAHAEDAGPAHEEGGGRFARVFTKRHLDDTRAAATELIELLNDYYGGKYKAREMLVNNWLAPWQLEDGFAPLDDATLDENGERYVDPDDDDDDAWYHRDDDDYVFHEQDYDDIVGNAREENRPLTARERGKIEKRAKKKTEKLAAAAAAKNGGGRGRELDSDRELGNKAKGLEEGKRIVNVEDMDDGQLKRYHHHRRQRTTKLVQTMARALLNPRQSGFTIGTIGSSVAAGHDNCHYDSYEAQMERALSPIFSRADMFFVVQNAGEGGACGDDHRNQVYCVTHNVSPEVDIIHYSWTYFEKEEPYVQREQLIRWGQQMERKPLVHKVDARGKTNLCGGDVVPEVNLARTYAPYGYNSFCIETALFAGGHDYDAEIEAGLNRFAWQKQGDGYHNTTRYGEELGDEWGDLKQKRKDSLGILYRNWHPGPLGFQIVSDAFSYVYMLALLMALDIIEEDMNAGVDPRKRWFDVHERRDLEEREGGNGNGLRSRSLQTPLPEPSKLPKPLFCDPLYCSTPHPPNCFNFEKPTFGTPGITIKEQNGWKNFEDKKGWNYMVGKDDIAIVKALKNKEWEA